MALAKSNTISKVTTVQHSYEDVYIAMLIRYPLQLPSMSLFHHIIDFSVNCQICYTQTHTWFRILNSSKGLLQGESGF